MYIHRVGQLPSLVRTLEQSLYRESGFDFTTRFERTTLADSRALGSESLSTLQHFGEVGKSACGLGRWIQRVTIGCFVPQTWYDVFCQGLERLLSLCPSLQVFVYTPLLNLPQFKSKTGEALIDYITLQDDGTSYSRNGSGSGVSLELKHLTLGPVAVPKNLDCLFANTVINLTSLELGYIMDTEFVEMTSPDVTLRTLCLPNLESLALVDHADGYPSRILRFIGQRWELPRLKKLFFNLADRFAQSLAIGDVSIQSLLELLDHVGSRIETLYSDERILAYATTEDFRRILQRCPVLRDLTIPFRETEDTVDQFSGPSLPHNSLTKLTLRKNGITDHVHLFGFDSKRFHRIMQELSIPKKYPSLKTVHLSFLLAINIRPVNDDITPQTCYPPWRCGAIEHTLQLDQCVKDRRLNLQSAQALSNWVSTLNGLGINVEDYQNRRLVPLSGLYDNENEDDASDNPGTNSDASDYVDSDASVTTSYEDSDIDSDLQLGETSQEETVPEQISWDEALDLFDESQVRNFDSDSEESTSEE